MSWLKRVGIGRARVCRPVGENSQSRCRLTADGGGNYLLTRGRVSLPCVVDPEDSPSHPVIGRSPSVRRTDHSSASLLALQYCTSPTIPTFSSCLRANLATPELRSYPWSSHILHTCRDDVQTSCPAGGTKVPPSPIVCGLSYRRCATSSHRDSNDR